jgi:hypothetical protein
LPTGSVRECRTNGPLPGNCGQLRATAGIDRSMSMVHPQVMSESATFDVVVSAVRFRPGPGEGVVLPHRWTSGGVLVQCDFTGAHSCHLSAAGCILNDLYREARDLGRSIDGARVCASGGFDGTTRASTGVAYEVEVASEASDGDIAHLLEVVDAVAEFPKALRSGTTVVRVRPS